MVGVLEGSAVELTLVLVAVDELGEVVVEDEVVTAVLLVELELVVETRVLVGVLVVVVVGVGLGVGLGLGDSAAEPPNDHVPCKVPTLT